MWWAGAGRRQAGLGQMPHAAKQAARGERHYRGVVPKAPRAGLKRREERQERRQKGERGRQGGVEAREGQATYSLSTFGIPVALREYNYY